MCDCSQFSWCDDVYVVCTRSLKTFEFLFFVAKEEHLFYSEHSEVAVTKTPMTVLMKYENF